MKLYYNRIFKYFIDVIKESLVVALPLYRIMIPMIVLVKILKEAGIVELLGHWLAPLMSVVGLPGSMGLVWAATMLGGFFPGIIIFADFSATEVLNVRQVTVLSSLMLIAHSLPIELKIVNKAGANWFTMGIIRIFGALIYGIILNQFLLRFNMLKERNVLLWYPKLKKY